MKLGSNLELTYVQVILKFGYDEINISCRKALLKQTYQIPVSWAGIKNIAKLNDLVFTLNGEMS